MNTKQSAIIGWVAYTAAFAIGGGIGLYRYKYAPGGRRDREAAADKLRQEEAIREAEEENRIREQRRLAAIESAVKQRAEDQQVFNTQSQSQER